jgi:hypothetical protein
MPFVTGTASYTMLYRTSSNFIGNPIYYFENYTFVAHQCRKLLQKSGVSIYVNKNIISSNFNLEAYCNDGVTEVCGVKFKFQDKDIYLLFTGHLLVTSLNLSNN